MEIVDLAIENGDFPVRFLLVYQRVSGNGSIMVVPSCTIYPRISPWFPMLVHTGVSENHGKTPFQTHGSLHHKSMMA